MVGVEDSDDAVRAALVGFEDADQPARAERWSGEPMGDGYDHSRRRVIVCPRCGHRQLRAAAGGTQSQWLAAGMGFAYVVIVIRTLLVLFVVFTLGCSPDATESGEETFLGTLVGCADQLWLQIDHAGGVAPAEVEICGDTCHVVQVVGGDEPIGCVEDAIVTECTTSDQLIELRLALSSEFFEDADATVRVMLRDSDGVLIADEIQDVVLMGAHRPNGDRCEPSCEFADLTVIVR